MIAPIGTGIANSVNTTNIQAQTSESKTDKTATGIQETEANSVATTTKVTTDGDTEKATSIYGDTVEISSQGMAKAKGMAPASQTPPSGSKPAATPPTGTQATGTTTGSATIKLEDITATEDEDDTDSTTDLSQYSDSDLKQMLAEGKITSAAYSQEMESRKNANDNAKEEALNAQKNMVQPLA